MKNLPVRWTEPENAIDLRWPLQSKDRVKGRRYTTIRRDNGHFWIGDPPTRDEWIEYIPPVVERPRDHRPFWVPSDECPVCGTKETCGLCRF